MLIAVTGMRREARLFPQGSEVVVSGAGHAGLPEKIEAAIARGAKAVISAGIGGGLAPGLPVGSVVIGREIVAANARYGADTIWASALALRLPGATAGTIIGADAIVAAPEEKSELHRKTGAIAVDMETHIAARVAEAYGLPFAALRVISDAAEDRLPPAVHGAMDADGHVRLGPVLASIARRPWQIPGLIRTGRNSDLALRELLRCFDLLGVGLGCPHLG